ncbi:MAG: heme o synthase [Actinomycetota bacterium]
MTRFSKLAWTAAGSTLALITLGALVRATDSGEACPDWPTCFGKWVPPLRAQTIIEYSHRLSASVVGFLVLALAVTAWLKHRTQRSIFLPSFLALLTVGFQAWIGRQVVLGGLPRNLVALHLFTALTVLGLLTFVAAGSVLPRRGRWDKTTSLAAGAAAMTMSVVLLGAFVSQYGAALVFPDWPLMNGSLAPPKAGLALLHYFHRIAAAVLGILLGWLAMRVTKAVPKNKALLKLAHGAFALWLAQALIGGLNVITHSAEWAIVFHVAFGALLWATLIAMTLTSHRWAEPGAQSQDLYEEALPGVGIRERVKAYVGLTKPRIIELLLITTVPSMILAARGWPSMWLVLATLVGGTLTAGSANSINCYIDRDIDEKMERTAARPLPRHAVTPVNALRFGIVLGIVGFVFLTLTTNLLAAALAAGAILFYVFIYTLWMKRSTPSNIVIGGAAGAAPALVGWAAVTGSLARPAWILFAIIFYWTPPHFWALAIKYSDQYKAADVPMLPVVSGVPETTRQMVFYSVALAAISLFLFPVAQLGFVYLIACVVLNAAFTGYALHLRANPSVKRAMRLFHFSISYLVLLFVAVAVDASINQAAPEIAFRVSLAIAAVMFVFSQAALLAAVVGSNRPAVPDALNPVGS